MISGTGGLLGSGQQLVPQNLRYCCVVSLMPPPSVLAFREGHGPAALSAWASKYPMRQEVEERSPRTILAVRLLARRRRERSARRSDG